MDGERNVVRLEVGFHVLAVQVVDNAIRDEEAPTPLFVDVGKVLMLWVEDVIHELEACVVCGVPRQRSVLTFIHAT